MTYDKFLDLTDYERDNWFLNAYDTKIIEDEPAWHSIFQEICWGDWFETIDRERGEDGRWTAWIDVIFKVKDRYFRIGYDMGLTEYQENDYYDKSVIEVVPEEKTIVVREWVERN